MLENLTVYSIAGYLLLSLVYTICFDATVTPTSMAWYFLKRLWWIAWKREKGYLPPAWLQDQIRDNGICTKFGTSWKNCSKVFFFCSSFCCYDWMLVFKLHLGRFFAWIAFPFENAVRRNLVERLLQLVFLIRINHYDFPFDLSALLRKFMIDLPTYNFNLPPHWRAIVESQINLPPHDLCCAQFVNMMHTGLGETYCLLKRYLSDSL